MTNLGIDLETILIIAATMLFLSFLLVIVLLIVLLKRASNRKQKANATADSPGPKDGSEQKKIGFWRRILGLFFAPTKNTALAISFSDGLKLLKNHISRRDYRYRLPWFLMLGESGSGKTDALRNSGLNLPAGDPITGTRMGNKSCLWWLFDHGIILDVSGEVFLEKEIKTSKFRDLISLLLWHRPKKPIDGIILSIPATDFVGIEKLSPEKLIEKYREINTRLRYLQNKLGMIVPVYVIVTKLDHVRGFKQFWNLVPTHRQKEIFGWSNPNSPTSRFSNEWTADAFQKINNSLSKLQLELALSVDGNSADCDDLFFFPREFGKIEESLSLCVSQIFHMGSSYDNFVLRGVYFSGLASSAEFEFVDSPQSSNIINADSLSFPELTDADGIPLPAPEIISPVSQINNDGRQEVDFQSDTSRPILLNQLFGEKILRESGLGSPLQDAILSRRRSVRLSQVAALLLITVLGSALIIETRSLSKISGETVPTLRQISETMKALDKRQSQSSPIVGMGSDTALTYLVNKSVDDITKALGRIDADTFQSYAIIPSVFSGLDSKIEQFLSRAIDTVILRAIQNKLRNDTLTVLAPLPINNEPAPINQTIVSIEQSPEHLNLKKLVKSLKRLEIFAKKYNGLAKTQSLRDLSDLIEGLFGKTLPPGFFENSRLYRNALAQIPKQYRYSFPEFKELTQTRFREFFQKKYDRVLHRGSLDVAMKNVTKSLRDFENTKPNKHIDTQKLLVIKRNVTVLDKILGSKGAAFLEKRDLELGEEFNKILSFVSGSEFFGTNDDFAIQLRKNGQRSFLRYKSRLGYYHTKQFGPILDNKNGIVIPKLSNSLSKFKINLDKLFNKSFMTVVDDRPIPSSIPTGKKLKWKKIYLDEAINIYRDYDLYISEDLNQFPKQFRNRITGLIKRRVGANIVKSISSAAGFETYRKLQWKVSSEEVISQDAREFIKQAPKLDRLLTILGTFGYINEKNNLGTIGAMQAGQLLVQIDGILQKNGPYLPILKVSNWSGNTSAAVALYGLEDDIEARLYLDFQRNRLQILAENLASGPVIYLRKRKEFLNSKNIRLVTRWDRIIEEISKYKSRRPDSSIASLERFLRFDLRKLTFKNCNSLNFSKGRFSKKNDYFTSVRYKIEKNIVARCSGLEIQDLSDRYKKLASIFNNNLAGLFPFAASAKGVSDLSPRTVKQFFQSNRNELKVLSKRFGEIKTNDTGIVNVRQFLKDLNSVDRFFSKILGKGNITNQPRPRLLLTPKFRLKRTFEVGGKEIIDWRLKSREVTIGLLDKNAGLSWAYGDPIALELQWADGAVTRPIDLGKSDINFELTDELTVRYQYLGSWSALRLIKSNKNKEMANAPTNVLEFRVPVRRLVIVDPKDMEKLDSLDYTRIFIGISLKQLKEGNKPVGKKLILPNFPTSAPPTPNIKFSKISG